MSERDQLPEGWLDRGLESAAAERRAVIETLAKVAADRDRALKLADAHLRALRAWQMWAEDLLKAGGKDCPHQLSDAALRKELRRLVRRTVKR